MKQVTDSVYVEIDYMGCNPGVVVTSAGLVMIDTPQRPSDALQYRSEIEKLGSVQYLINTDSIIFGPFCMRRFPTSGSSHWSA